MFKQLLLAAVVLGTGACASFRTITYAAPFAMQLEVREAHGTVSDTVMDDGGDDLGSYVKPLMGIAQEIGYKVVIAPAVTLDGLPLWGYTDKEKKIVYLSLDQSVNNFVHTFIHELSHAMQPMPVSPDGQVFAETVSSIVTDALGGKSQEDSFAYISRYDDNIEVIRRYSEAIDKLVKFFLTRLQK